MSIVLVGNRGYVGSRLEAYLRSQGLEVVGLEHDSVFMDASSGCLKTDYNLPSHCQAVIYLAQSPFYRLNNENCSHLLAVNTMNAVRLAQLATENGVNRFIYASTGNVYAPSFDALAESSLLRKDNWYSLSKIHAEEALALFREKLDLTIVRPFGIYGPGQADKLVPGMLERLSSRQEILIDRNPLIPEDLDGLKISLCYIDDVVKMLTDLIDVTGVKILNLAGNEVASIRKIATIAAQELGVTPVFRLTEKYRNFDLIADTTYLQEALNPVLTPLSAGISATVKAYAQQCDNGRLL